MKLTDWFTISAIFSLTAHWLTHNTEARHQALLHLDIPMRQPEISRKLKTDAIPANAFIIDANEHTRLNELVTFDDNQVNENLPIGILNEEDETNKCLVINEPICQGLEYSQTKLPNVVGLNTQEEAAKRMNDYRALISVGCSHYLKFFLCTIYFPMCTTTPSKIRILQSCREFCRYVQSKCEPIMKSFSFPWPKELNCNSLPPSSDMCIQPQNYELDRQQVPAVSSNEIAYLLPDLKHFLNEKYSQVTTDPKSGQAHHSKQPLSSGGVKTYVDSQQQHIVKKSDKVTCAIFEVKMTSDKLTDNATCTKRCFAHVFYRDAEKQFADIWILGWSLVCAVACTITVLTFITDRARFIYPERPIVYISICYLCYSIGYILRIGLGRERVACRDRTNSVYSTSHARTTELVTFSSTIQDEMLAHQLALESTKYLIQSGHEGTWCTFIFIIIYYFSQASYVWWVMLAITWFLSAACKWGYEGVESVSSVFHMLAWSLPAVMTMVVLLMHRIDADELTGLCFVGYQDPSSLLFFVLIPQILYLLIGVALFAVGFFSLISVRTNLKQQLVTMRITSKHNVANTSNCLYFGHGSNHSQCVNMGCGNVRRLDKLMIKMCIFSVLYIMPSICVIGVNLYAYNGHALWQSALDKMTKQPGCQSIYGTNWQRLEECLAGHKFPSVEIHMLHSFMSLVVGITAGMWVWCNRKTFSMWINLIKLRCFSGTNHIKRAPRWSKNNRSPVEMASVPHPNIGRSLDTGLPTHAEHKRDTEGIGSLSSCSRMHKNDSDNSKLALCMNAPQQTVQQYQHSTRLPSTWHKHSH